MTTNDKKGLLSPSNDENDTIKSPVYLGTSYHHIYRTMKKGKAWGSNVRGVLGGDIPKGSICVTLIQSLADKLSKGEFLTHLQRQNGINIRQTGL